MIQTLNIEFNLEKADLTLNTLIQFIESCTQGPSRQNKYRHCMFLFDFVALLFSDNILNCMF